MFFPNLFFVRNSFFLFFFVFFFMRQNRCQHLFPFFLLCMVRNYFTAEGRRNKKYQKKNIKLKIDVQKLFFVLPFNSCVSPAEEKREYCQDSLSWLCLVLQRHPPIDLRQLLQPDACFVSGKQLPYQFTKINASIGFKVKCQFMTVVLIFSTHQHHG